MNDPRRRYRELVTKLEKQHGPLHPGVLELPFEVQLELLEQAEARGVVVDARSIDAFLGDLDAHIDAIKQLAQLVGRPS